MIHRRTTRIRRAAWRWVWRLMMFGVAAGVILLVGRAVQSQSGPPLQLWHIFVPEEPHAEAIDRLDWAGYLAAEARVFASVRSEVTDRLDDADRTPDDRFFAGSPVYPGRFKQDWNRSYVLEPDGMPLGAVVLLHGLTDAPYSLRHIARLYRDLGYVAIGLRTPAHGTVPAALTDTSWEDWLAATRLAVREARRRVGPNAPLHMVGFSAGGAFALKYALDAIEDPTLSRPDRLVLISPMVGISSFARFAGLAALPALLPPFAKAAWLSIVPEFNPFKYNSFPVNGARQAHRLTVAVQQQLDRLAQAGRLGDLAPVLTFQSAMDSTVSSRAVVTTLYDRLPANGSELVVFDLNRNTKLGPLLRGAFAVATDRLEADAPRNWRLTLIANTPDSAEVTERVTAVGGEASVVRRLGLVYPRQVFSLSHVALPFPASDALYGSEPDGAEDFGVNFGELAARGEVGVLIISMDSLTRISWNPFFSYLVGRIKDGISPHNGSRP